MGKTALTGGMLIDGSGGEPILNSLVLVEDKKIVYAGAAKPYGADYETRDISGKTVMPGLVGYASAFFRQSDGGRHRMGAGGRDTKNRGGGAAGA